MFSSWKKISKIEMLSACKQIELAELMYYLGDTELGEIEIGEDESCFPTISLDVRKIVNEFIKQCRADE
jgi:hypothetical protein